VEGGSRSVEARARRPASAGEEPEDCVTVLSLSDWEGCRKQAYLPVLCFTETLPFICNGKSERYTTRHATMLRDHAHVFVGYRSGSRQDHALGAGTGVRR
jgi:hypothetical protein